MNNFYEVKPLIKPEYKGVYKIFEKTEEVKLPIIIYLIVGKKKAVLIDTGVENHGLLEVVRTITQKPVFVLHTHGHLDHVGADEDFDEIYMNLEELKMEGRGFIWDQLDTSKFKPLHEGDTFDLGGITLRTVFTPGHTIGCVSFISDELKLAFTGDGIADIHWFDEFGGGLVSDFHDMMVNFKNNIGEDYKIYATHVLHGFGYRLAKDLVKATGDVVANPTDQVVNADYGFLKHGDMHKHPEGSVIIYYKDQYVK